MAEGNGLRPQEINYKVAVGVDFGTYGSAIASMLLVAGGGGRGPDVQHEVKFGTTAEIGPLDKTPTSLLLNEEYEITTFGAAALDEYLQKDEDSKEEFYFCEKFKMALFEEGGGEGESMILDFIEADNGEQVPTSAVLQQSLKYVFEFVMTKSQLSQSIPSLNPREIQWVLTVPAIWTEKAKKKMREAAANAGMTPNGPNQLLIAKEPECASIMVEAAIQDQQTYVLVDAGGGTIDIACHKKVQSDVIEVFPPTGGSWGSTYIDREFGEMLIECFGEDVIEEFKVDEECRSGWIEQMQKFAKAKENSKSGKPKNVPLANMFFEHLMSIFDDKFDAFADHLANFEYKGVRGLSAKKGRAMLYISSEMWELLFSVVLDPICNHINHLLDEPSLQECSQVVLVGGFGGSDRLYQALVDLVAERDRLAGRDGPTITIYQAHHPNLCVVNGAAQYPSVKDKFTRVAPRTYGVESLAKWTDGHPDDEWKVQFDGVWRYRKGFKKFVTIGEKLGENHTVVHKFRPAASSGVSVNIYCSTEESPKTTLRARQIGRTFVDFTDLPPERRSPEQILKILFHFGSSEIKAELQFEDGMVKPLDCDFTDVSFAAEIAQKYASS